LTALRFADPEAKLPRRKITVTERGEVTKFLREYKSVKREEFDLEQIYVPHPGPWLSVPSGPREKPDRVIVVLGPRLSAGRFALVQLGRARIRGRRIYVRGAREDETAEHDHTHAKERTKEEEYMITKAALTTLQVPPLILALAIAELFFKLHSFTLEARAFVGVWYVLRWAYAPLQRRVQTRWSLPAVR